MNEIEVLTQLDKDDYDRISKRLTSEYGDGKHVKRLGFIISSMENNKPIDTRIKITNGVIHLVQKKKVKSAGQVYEKEEKELELDMDADSLLQLIRIMEDLSHDRTMPIQRYEYYLFDTSTVEVKLYKQFNNENTFYGAEIELLDHKRELMVEIEELEIKIDNIERDADYWDKYDKTYNTEGRDLSNKELKLLIAEYL
jgi:hypothetical protein